MNNRTADLVAPEQEPSDVEDALVQQLVRLIARCESCGFDLDLLMVEARRIHDGVPAQST